MSKITDLVYQMAEPIVKEHDCQLWDVEYVKEAGTWYLRVFIDKEGGVNIDDCEQISRVMDPMLDEVDFIQDSYVFEVGSAGLERELKRPRDFEQFVGSEVEVKLYRPVDGSKAFVGKLEAYVDGAVTISVSGKEITFNKDQIALVKLHVTI